MVDRENEIHERQNEEAQNFQTKEQIATHIMQQSQGKRKHGKPKKNDSIQAENQIDLKEQIEVNAKYLQDMIKQLNNNGEFIEQVAEKLLTEIIQQMCPGIKTLDQIPITITKGKVNKGTNTSNDTN